MNEHLNGRVNIMNCHDQNAFLMSDRIPLTQPTSYHDALNGTIENTLLSEAFFSGKNIQIIQNGIRAGVYYQSNNQFIIDKQSTDQLKMIMRGVFLEHSVHLETQIPEQINQLNQTVINDCVPRIITEAKCYTKYKQDVSTLVTPMDRPTASDYKYKTLELKKWF